MMGVARQKVTLALVRTRVLSFQIKSYVFNNQSSCSDLLSTFTWPFARITDYIYMHTNMPTTRSNLEAFVLQQHLHSTKECSCSHYPINCARTFISLYNKITTHSNNLFSPFYYNINYKEIKWCISDLKFLH